jgi:hypothetical protein
LYWIGSQKRQDILRPLPKSNPFTNAPALIFSARKYLRIMSKGGALTTYQIDSRLFYSNITIIFWAPAIE